MLGLFESLAPLALVPSSFLLLLVRHWHLLLATHALANQAPEGRLRCSELVKWWASGRVDKDT